jgi:hypothetical protein
MNFRRQLRNGLPVVQQHLFVSSVRSVPVAHQEPVA